MVADARECVRNMSGRFGPTGNLSNIVDAHGATSLTAKGRQSD